MLELNKIYLANCLELMPFIPKGSIDLICTDIEYCISKESGFEHNSAENTHYSKKYGKTGIVFGEWDKKENITDLNLYAKECFRILKPGGVFVTFYDHWKAETLKNTFETVGFKQPRCGSWVKTNPVPKNSKVNILTNGKEYFYSFVKGKKPTYNEQYWNGDIFFQYPICSGKERTLHTTQKPVAVVEELIKIYSNEGDIVLDTHIGSGTTAVACVKNKRFIIGMEREPVYFNVSTDRLNEVITTIKGGV